ncbi:ABC transporter ATP-binding protein [Marinospirillum minutulum]|uniref:ABC transporter ATP-binding protein n=1 Tax=Marinospirillum minutulum TaxID=64974 RepID=UPI0004091649|nr:ATP-binding cassette domain-containing protein [Marinospirillum minutulum]
MIQKKNGYLKVDKVDHDFVRTQVLQKITFSIKAGEVCALVGPSGCGKTTLLHLCNGLLDLQDGVIQNTFQNTASMFQQPRLLPWKTCLDNMTLGLKARGFKKQERNNKALKLASLVGLQLSDLEKFPHQLSGGMQSRVALARVLLLEPDLLLLDEPFSALDIGLKTELYLLLLEQQTQRNLAVLMITHDLMEAVRLCDTILLMNSQPGRIAARFNLTRSTSLRDDAWVYQTTAELLQQTVVRKSFELPVVTNSSPVDLRSCEWSCEC